MIRVDCRKVYLFDWIVQINITEKLSGFLRVRDYLELRQFDHFFTKELGMFNRIYIRELYT